MPSYPIPSGFSPTVTTNRGNGRFSQRGGSRNVFWKPSRQLVKDVLTNVREQYGEPIQYFPRSTVVPTSAALGQGIAGIEQKAGMGSPVVAPAEELGARTLRGDFLTAGNPYLDEYFSRAARGVTAQYQNTIRPEIESRFAGAGGSGRGSYAAAVGRAQEGLGQSLGDLASQVYMGAYEAERGRQQQTLALSPVIQSLGYADMDQMLRAGALQQHEGQRLLDADVAKWRFQQMEPWQRAGLASGIAYGGGPVSEGTNFWQEGTSSEEGKQVLIAPEQQQSGGGMGSYWLGLLASFL
jgi:hypothetical protein